jgi:hypothetical protein
LLRLLLPLSLLLSASPVVADETTPFASADARGTVGEAGSLHLLRDSVYVHPLNNDIAGRTDKYLTHSTRIGYNGIADNGEGYDVRASWRFITPDYIGLGQSSAPRVIGNYGDWAEIQFARAMLFNLPDARLHVQFAAGLGHLGPKGAKTVQVNLHKELDNAYEHLTWVEKQRGISASSGILVGYAPMATYSLLGGHVHHMASLQFNDTLVMLDAALTDHVVLSFGDAFKVGLESKIVRQMASILYQDAIEPYRIEASFGVLLTRWYKPTINYVSNYLRGDAVPQYYFDFINFNVPL